MDLEVAESVNLDGTINHKNIQSNLTQDIKEKNIGFFFNKTAEHDLDASFNFSAEYRQDVAGQEGEDGIQIGLNFMKKLTLACGIPDTGIKLLDQKLDWAKNPKCYDENGTKKDVKLLYATDGNNDKSPTALGLKYDLETDKFVPINPEESKLK